MPYQHIPMVERPSVLDNTEDEKLFNTNHCSVIEVKSKSITGELQETNSSPFSDNLSQNDEIFVEIAENQPNDGGNKSTAEATIEEIASKKNLQKKKNSYWIFLVHLFLGILLILGVHFGPQFGLQPLTTCWIILGFGIFLSGAFCLYIRKSK